MSDTLHSSYQNEEVCYHRAASCKASQQAKSFQDLKEINDITSLSPASCESLEVLNGSRFIRTSSFQRQRYRVKEMKLVDVSPECRCSDRSRVEIIQKKTCFLMELYYLLAISKDFIRLTRNSNFNSIFIVLCVGKISHS